MSVIDVITPVDTAADGARQCRKILYRGVVICQRSCERIAEIVTKYGRADIAAALGPDAVDLATLYNQLKAIADAYHHPVPNLPASKEK